MKTEMDLTNDNQNIDKTPFTVIELADDRVACKRWNQFKPSILYWIYSDLYSTCVWDICICMKAKQCWTIFQRFVFAIAVSVVYACVCIWISVYLFIHNFAKIDLYLYAIFTGWQPMLSRLSVKNPITFASYVYAHTVPKWLHGFDFGQNNKRYVFCGSTFWY